MKKNNSPKILLISLRDPYLDSDRVMPPLGVMSLNSYLHSCGISSHIENDFDFSNPLKYSAYTHFGISCMTPQKKQAYEVLYAIKKQYPDRIVIIGGPHADFYTQQCLDHPFDYIVVGDGELALKEIILKQPDNGRIINISVTEKQMNEFPLPYRDPSFLTQYNFYVQGLKATTILTAKGCPMSCAFCEHAGTKVRLYDPGIIDKQISQAKKSGYNCIMFFDDIFALSLKRVKDLTNIIRKHDITYRCFGHARTMTEEMAKLLAETGCIEMGFGAESGSQLILDKIDKKTTVEQNQRFVDLCNNFGIKVKAFMIVGLPGESYETVQETKKFLDFLTRKRFKNRFRDTVSNDFDVTIYFPYKGTKIRDLIDAGSSKYDLLILEDPDVFEGYYKGKSGSAEALVRTSALSTENIIKIQKDLLKSYKQKTIQFN
ncbi:B12-binding domain-containing radical SAM protein [Thermodesulfobacteriota bacterium]